ncbi:MULTISPECIES: hypothetical protein [Acinetobacter]|uniref:Uncharacterized protein n=1 Tax=Acinetobacter indicus TaxID=756892 RepID=A0A6C0Y710_9GAMM|nr:MULTISPECIES: hypothetical protein [Acinetobacter]QIC72047.1 hypothetical protein FSC09_16960 [Acinetobacter indicus]QKQ71553.1 hypothetical protein E5Y90_15075 [Acinetobacter sp. 10FS3-1]
MSRFIDIEELSKNAKLKLPPQIAQTGYYGIKSLPVGKPNTMLSGYSGVIKTYSVNGIVYKGPHEIRMLEIKTQQADDVPILYMAILKEYLL